jgi:ATP-dependent helicase/nuclease subunit B
MAEIEKSHQVSVAWARLMARIDGEMQGRDVHPARTIVLLPYAQLMPQAKEAWQAWTRSPEAVAAPSWRHHFLPRFESTRNWAGTVTAWVAAADDISFDRARDQPHAAWLLERAGLGAQRQTLAAMLVDAAWQLGEIAAAMRPDARADWAEQARASLGALAEGGALAFEAATQRIALEWAAASGYASDVLWTQDIDCLMVLQGLQVDALAGALLLNYGERALALELATSADRGLIRLLPAAQAEEEAATAAACVLAHLQQGRRPVALIAQDRTLTRRVRAMLDARGLAIRDETGWKLSTTRAAARLMALLRAMAWDAGSDAVLDWLKQAPAFARAQVSLLEAELRGKAIRDWPGLRLGSDTSAPLLQAAEAIRAQMVSARPLADWLTALQQALQQDGQWQALDQDAAGEAVLDALCLRDGARGLLGRWTRRLAAGEFLAWVNQTLEAASFKPEHPVNADLVILPMSQLLGRPFAAVVMPGCDEGNLPASPEPAGLWTRAQRVVLGLPSREDLQHHVRAAWACALQMPMVDILWRTSERGDLLASSTLVQELELPDGGPLAEGVDPRCRREVALRPLVPPGPSGQLLPLARLSASAYEDMRNCPYRFFALRLLRLRETEELDSEVGKREFGTWLHAVLRAFHEDLAATPAQDPAERLAMIDRAAERAGRELGLDPAGMVPMQAAWPGVRDGYLQWLTTHEEAGWVFASAESDRRVPMGAIELIGTIDRIDQRADGRRLVLDYKTENSQRTASRIKNSPEDTQLAFYAALLEDDELDAAYLNLSEKDGSKAFVQHDIVALRDALVLGIRDDMGRVAAGAPLPALGQGETCTWCAARGLCRRDFREEVS